jgi:hypothetical protein
VRGGIIANEYGRQARPDAGCAQLGNFALEFGVDLLANFVAVEYAGGHRKPSDYGITILAEASYHTAFEPRVERKDENRP